MRIGVFGHVGNQNLGDEALIGAVIQNVRRRYPEAEVVGFTRRPSDTRERHGIPAFPIHRMNGRARPWPAARTAVAGSGRGVGAAWEQLRSLLKRVALARWLVRAARRFGGLAVGLPAEVGFLVRAYRNLRGTDLLLVAGSGQLNDYWEGSWGIPLTLFKWALLARATGTKLALLSLGAGPLRTRVGKFFVKQTVRLAAYRSYRDDDSRRCVVALGVRGPHPVVPDLVFSLDVPLAPRAAPVRQRLVVGINPMPWFDDLYYPESDPRLFGTYVQTLATFADWLVERQYTVLFFVTQLVSDPGVIDRVRGLMRASRQLTEPGQVITARVGCFDELLTVLDALDLVVATRYHGTLFSMIRLKPVVSIAYQRKSLELMRDMGQAEYAIAIDELTPAGLQDRFLALEQHRGEIVASLRQQLPGVRSALDTQYDRAFAVLG